MKKPYTISPTTLKIYEDCPRCFWLHFNKGMKRPSMPFPSLPNGIDRVLKDYYDIYRRGNKLPPEIAELNKEGVKLYNDYDKLDDLRKFNKGMKWKNKKGDVVRGALDDLLEKDGKFIVLDYKTRGFPLKEDTVSFHKMQLEVYTFLLGKSGFETEDYGYLIFYHPKKVEGSRAISFETDLVKVDVSVGHAERFIKKALNALRGRIPKSSEDCDYCSWIKKVRG